MHTSAFLVSLAFAIRGAVAADYSAWTFGNMFETGPARSGNFIQKATWSLVPPAVPVGATMKDKTDPPFASIWVGVASSLSDDSSTLVQPLLNWSPDQASQGCSASASEWCVAASTYYPVGLNGQNQKAYVRVPAGSKLSFEIDTTANKVSSQKVWLNGNLVSSQTDKIRDLPLYLYSSNECYQNSCGDIAAYSWGKVTIVLNEADASYGSTLSLRSASGSFSTPDGGKTWTASSIGINKDHFPK